MDKEKVALRFRQLVPYGGVLTTSPAVLKAVQAIVQEAVEEERDACVKICEENWSIGGSYASVADCINDILDRGNP